MSIELLDIKILKGFDMKTNILKKVITLSLLASTFTFASATKDTTFYANMETIELQRQVELLSKVDAVPFQMGMELIKRWTKS